MKRVVISASFDNLRSDGMRFLQAASTLGEVHVILWPDATVKRTTGADPAFPIAERKYMVEANRYVANTIIPGPDYAPATLPAGEAFDIWVARQEDTAEKEFCAENGLIYTIIGDDALTRFPVEDRPVPKGEKTVIVTGCFDWFHSGHIRFFEEVSELGKLYVAVGNDKNVRMLKGEGHPMFPEDERRFVCDSIKYVHQAIVSTGEGWMDSEPEIQRLRPDMYAVNEDGDKPEKKAFCDANGLEYVVLKRTPKEGLTRRSSTDLRGF